MRSTDQPAGGEPPAAETVDGREQFRSVVLPHLTDALAFAKWLVGNGSDAEDVVQEACLRAFRSIGSFSGKNSKAWILAIVRNTAYSWLAKNRPGQVVSTEELGAAERTQAERGDFVAHEQATPEAEVIQRADRAMLHAAIAGLPAPYRETLVLRDIHGLDYRVIASITAVPVGTVMSRLARARGRLMQAIGQGH